MAVRPSQEQPLQYMIDRVFIIIRNVSIVPIFIISFIYRVIKSNCILWFLSDGHKKTPNWQNPTIFVKILYGHFDILISQKGQVKKFPPFRVVPKLCVFHPDMVQGCLGVSVWVCWCPLIPHAAFMIWGDI